jgi:glycogen operon protein
MFSKSAQKVELLLYQAVDSAEPLQVVQLDPNTNRTYFYWHVLVVGLRPGAFYTWRIDGKEVVDPWARAVTDAVWNRQRAVSHPGSTGHSLRAMVTANPEPASRESALTPSLSGGVIYELHVGGFTQHPSSEVQYPGTFLGLIEKIPYLKELGVTHVELLPVIAFDDQDVPQAVQARNLRNYWGYSPHSFYSPHPHYCVKPDHGTQQSQFRQLVDALHSAGIRVILDVVFNHTA